MPPSRRIACLSTSRADAGIYRPLLRALAADGRFEPILLAGGTHTIDAFGKTIDDLSDLTGVRIEPVAHHSPGDDPVSVARSAGAAVGAFAAALARVRPDRVIVLGDRAEMLAAALAATLGGFPIAHLHGGDTTEGAYDDACRHAITQLADLHFPALPQHAAKIAAMGRERANIHVAGALALDDLREFRPESVTELSAAVGLDFSAPTLVVAFHPETRGDLPAAAQIDAVLAVLRPVDAGLLLIGPNADVGHDAVRTALAAFAGSRPRAVLVANLPRHRYWSALAHTAALVGNSSAGLLEAPSFKLPVVNIGRRQQGRVRAANVIDVDFSADAIRAALAKALSPEFRAGLADLKNPYGDGHAAQRIINVLATELTPVA